MSIENINYPGPKGCGRFLPRALMNLIGGQVGKTRVPPPPGQFFSEGYTSDQSYMAPRRTPEFDSNTGTYYVKMTKRMVSSLGEVSITMEDVYFQDEIEAKWAILISDVLNNTQHEQIQGMDIDDLDSMNAGIFDYSQLNKAMILPQSDNLKNDWHRDNSDQITWALRVRMNYDINNIDLQDEDVVEDILNIVAIYSKTFLENTSDFAHRSRNDYPKDYQELNPEFVHPKFLARVEKYIADTKYSLN